MLEKIKGFRKIIALVFMTIAVVVASLIGALTPGAVTALEALIWAFFVGNGAEHSANALKAYRAPAVETNGTTFLPVEEARPP